LGHNLDFEGSSEKATDSFKKLLKIDPNNPQGNYLYGMFLSNTRKYHFDGVPYLEKALKLGVEDSRYTLGLLRVQQGRREEGLKLLKQYSEKNPQNDHVKRVIKAIESGDLKFMSN